MTSTNTLTSHGRGPQTLVLVAAHVLVADWQFEAAQNAGENGRNVRLPIDATHIVSGHGANQVHHVRVPGRVVVHVPQRDELLEPQIVAVVGVQEDGQQAKHFAAFASVQGLHCGEQLVQDLLRR